MKVCQSEYFAFSFIFFLIILSVFLFSGEPDLTDAIIQTLQENLKNEQCIN